MSRKPSKIWDSNLKEENDSAVAKIVIRYLVVHEVAHIRFRHHQESFWAEVERLMPEYREAERLIKEEGWQWVF